MTKELYSPRRENESDSILRPMAGFDLTICLTRVIQIQVSDCWKSNMDEREKKGVMKEREG